MICCDHGARHQGAGAVVLSNRLSRSFLDNTFGTVQKTGVRKEAAKQATNLLKPPPHPADDLGDILNKCENFWYSWKSTRDSTLCAPS
jgi:hypothetical protein